MWQKILRTNITSLKSLVDFLEIDLEKQHELVQSSDFSLNLPLRLAKKIEKNNLCDPIFLQFVPSQKEEHSPEHFSCNPVQDQEARKSPKLLHKYQNRALLLCTQACPMHCRFCFRRHFPYAKVYGYEEELLFLESDTSIHEIILSGGDPLSLSNALLEHLIQQFNAISHLVRLRFHSRFPIGIPERIDNAFLDLLKRSRLQVWFVIHCNHPNELDDAVIESFKRLIHQGVPVLSQTVLLKGVNDSIQVLQSLFEKLINVGVQPYYLHQLDPVMGAAHFETNEEEGIKLLRKLQLLLPGYAIPRYVREEGSYPSKTFIF